MITVWSTPAPTIRTDLLVTVTGVVHVHEPALHVIVVPLLAALMAFWSVVWSQLIAPDDGGGGGVGGGVGGGGGGGLTDEV